MKPALSICGISLLEKTASKKLLQRVANKVSLARSIISHLKLYQPEVRKM